MNFFKITICTICVLILSISCNKKTKSTLFEKLLSEHTGIQFNNQLTESEEENVLNYEYFYNGGGVAAADFNNDSLIDLFFTGNQVSNKLYLNKGKLQFEDITDLAFPDQKNNKSWHTGVSIVDINQDGWQDIYVSVSGNVDHPELRKNKLFVNQGLKNGNNNITFIEEAAKFGLDAATYSTQSAFLDYDKDGDLDVYLLNHNVKDYKSFDVSAIRFMKDSLAGHRLLQNDININGKFTDVTVKAGIKQSPINFGLGIHVADLNNDLWPDIYVSIDYLEEDFLYINNHDGTFTDEIRTRTNHISYFSMGNDIGDVNNDLLPDIITTDMLPEDNKRQKLLFGPDKYEAYLHMLKNDIQPSFMRNMLQLNNGNGTFSEIGQLAGISNTDWTWSVLMADFDNDGFKDVFFSNGYLRDYTNMDFMKYYADASIQSGIKMKDIVEKMPSTKTPNYIFKNNGAPDGITFSNKQIEWGFTEEVISNGAVAVDLDRDGDLDLVTNNLNTPAYIYKNRQVESSPNQSNYLEIELKDKIIEGTKVYVYSGDLKQFREYGSTHGYQSSNKSALHFGLALNNTVDSILIIWPDATKQRLIHLVSNQKILISKENNYNGSPYPTQKPYFDSVAFNAIHKQMPLNDFSRQILLPFMPSYIGPRMAKADVNKDGLEDFYMGGGKGYAGQLFIQTKQGDFTSSIQEAFNTDRICTDADAVFFDLEGDGDQDLLVASGGYQYLEHDLALHNRLYINDGKGNFSKSPDKWEETSYANSVVKTIDMDRDGDKDIILGGACVPQKYPLVHPTRIYKNNKGKLEFYTILPLDSLSIVNDVVISDIDKDGSDDILIASEWSGITVFKNYNGVFEKYDAGLETITGFWYGLLPIDIDLDGDDDLIAGNLGLNTQYTASALHPLTLSIADFDGNGSIDPIVSYPIKGISYPAYSRDELLDQLAVLKKKYTSYELYSTATISDILHEFKNKPIQERKIQTVESTLWINTNGKFKKGTLPIQTQFSPIYAIASLDVNHDRYPDLLIGGNQDHARVRIGKIDANQGMLLINNQKNGFEYIPQYKSGFQVKGDVKDILIIDDRVVFGVNNGPIKMYKYSKSGL